MWPRLALGAAGVLLTRFGTTFLSRLWHVLRQLWHELVGSVFALLAVGGASTFLREWRAGDSVRYLLAAGFAVTMGWFAFTSFRSARRIRKSTEAGSPKPVTNSSR